MFPAVMALAHFGSEIVQEFKHGEAFLVAEVVICALVTEFFRYFLSAITTDITECCFFVRDVRWLIGGCQLHEFVSAGVSTEEFLSVYDDS